MPYKYEPRKCEPIMPSAPAAAKAKGQKVFIDGKVAAAIAASATVFPPSTW